MESPATWRRLNPLAERDRWRHRESGWRKLHILARGGLHILGRGAPRYFNRHDYVSAWLAQEGRCGLCGKPLHAERWETASSGGVEVGTGRGINADHDHHTHLFRALVHGRCNRMLSTLTSREAEAVVAYLKRYEAEGASA